MLSTIFAHLRNCTFFRFVGPLYTHYPLLSYILLVLEGQRTADILISALGVHYVFLTPTRLSFNSSFSLVCVLAKKEIKV
jgi:hypothetical protein